MCENRSDAGHSLKLFHISRPLSNDFSSLPAVTHISKILEKVVNSRKLCQKELVFAQSPKGREMLLHDGHKYVISFREPKRIFWRCNNSQKYGCKAAASTNGNDFVLLRSHNHPRENFPVQVVKLKNARE
jgi:hypothetical protein